MRSGEFLNLYKQLEQVLKSKYEQEGGRYESPVVRFENSQEGRYYKEELNTIREIRNLLQHLPMVDGQYPVEPSAEVLDSLKEIIQNVTHPIKALDFAVQGEHIYKASMNSNLKQVTAVMSEHGYSHVPVFEGNNMFGVLSVSSVFDCLARKGSDFFTEDTKVGDLREFLPFEDHQHEFFMFTPRDALLYDVREMFETTYQHSKRLVIVFITENGRKTERLLGLISPWNVLRMMKKN